MLPIIGIILRDENKRKMSINKEVLEYISSLNAIPIGIYPKGIDSVLNLCDGFILQGGDDFTEFDLDLVDKVYKLNKPLLGICLGMQTMGYFFNGKLSKCGNHKSDDTYVHSINIIKGTKLYKIIGKTNILVNSRHFDCVMCTDATISAISDDGIIEAIEIPNHKFCLGVQWHPESLIDINSKKIFISFIDACKGEKACEF